MKGKAFFVDATKCTACRGCQIACKEWNQLPATKTVQWGSHQNPKDLSSVTWKLIRFTESKAPAGNSVWYFFADQCRHCLEPPCKEGTDIQDAIVIDAATGAVIHTKKLQKADAKKVREACPFDIPRADPKTNLFGKCTMCIDRVHSGLLPACVKTCPTGAMNFGERDKMVALAKSRLAERRKVNPKAELTGLEDLRVFYLLDGKPKEYWQFASLETEAAMDRMQALRRMTAPLKQTAAGRLLSSLFG